METIKYVVPQKNDEAFGIDTGGYNFWAVGGYLRGLIDSGVAERAESKQLGKGANVFHVEIDLTDITKKAEVDATLRMFYKAQLE